MEDNTRMMLQLATFLANKSDTTSETPDANQNNALLAQLAKQVLLNTNMNPQQREQHILHSPIHRHQQQELAGRHPIPATQHLDPVQVPQSQFPSNKNRDFSLSDNAQYPQSSNRSNNSSLFISERKTSDRTFGFSSSTGRLGLNTSNPRVLHALRLLKKRKKLKRGPKEKETFQRYFYCLPDKYSKLPKFSSMDPSEKNIVRQHQETGFGYPPDDYNDGIPRKTSICLSYSAEKFHNFIISMYPNIDNRLYDIYRIDKQRRLIRIEAKTPRDIKDMKYQGSLIIIPYDDENDRAPQILYRSGEDFFIQVASSTSPLFDQSTIFNSHTGLIHPLSPENTEVSLPTNSFMVPHDNTTETEMLIDPSDIKTEPEGTPVENSSLPSVSTDGGHSETEEMTLKEVTDFTQEKCKIIAIAKTIRNRLQSKKLVRVSKSSIILDILQLYRANPLLITHQISVCYIDGGQTQDMEQEPCLSMFVHFWNEILNSNFKGYQEVVPSTDIDMDDDFYFILGKILYHGMVLCDYWPMRLSQACLSTVLIDRCSERQLMTSFHHVMSEADRSVIGEAKKELKEGEHNVSMDTAHNVYRVLRYYGCRHKPQLSSLDGLLLRIAHFYLVKEPYWQLMEMRKGMHVAEGDIFRYTNDGDIFTLYSLFTPNALGLFEKVTYIYSNTDSNMEIEEKRVKMNFESFIMRLNTENLSKFLMKWCYSDCLCVEHLYIRFDPETTSQNPLFIPEHATLVLSSMYMSKEELHQFLSAQD